MPLKRKTIVSLTRKEKYALRKGTLLQERTVTGDTTVYYMLTKESSARVKKHPDYILVKKEWTHKAGPFPVGTITIGEELVDTLDKM